MTNPEYKHIITEHPMAPGSYQVETLGTDGKVRLALFGGFEAEERAKKYVELLNQPDRENPND